MRCKLFCVHCGGCWYCKIESIEFTKFWLGMTRGWGGKRDTSRSRRSRTRSFTDCLAMNNTFNYQTKTTQNGEAERNLYMPLADAPRNQASSKCMLVEELQTTVNAPSRHAILCLSVHDLSRVHQPVRIQCALDTSHHVDCIETEFLLQ